MITSRPRLSSSVAGDGACVPSDPIVPYTIDLNQRSKPKIKARPGPSSSIIIPNLKLFPSPPLFDFICELQGSRIRLVRGLVNFVPALA